MIERKLTIINKLGLHARAAAKLVRLATAYSSAIEVKTQCKTANGKSIMGLMMLAAAQGVEITLIVDGDDEKEACSALETLINQRFDEKE